MHYLLLYRTKLPKILINVYAEGECGTVCLLSQNVERWGFSQKLEFDKLVLSCKTHPQKSILPSEKYKQEKKMVEIFRLSKLEYWNKKFIKFGLINLGTRLLG